MVKAITRLTRLWNNFSKFGRAQNGLIKELKGAGCSQFYQRTLPNGSRVMTAYQKGKSTSAYTFLLNRDGTYVQKSTESAKAMVNWDRRSRAMTKVYASMDSDAVTMVRRLNVYDNGVRSLAQYEKILPDGTKIVRAKGAAAPLVGGIDTRGATESMAYLKPNGDYNVHLLRSGKPEFYIGNTGQPREFKFQFA